jgi:hypothetical protein
MYIIGIPTLLQVKWIHDDINSFSRDYNYTHICETIYIGHVK